MLWQDGSPKLEVNSMDQNLIVKESLIKKKYAGTCTEAPTNI